MEKSLRDVLYNYTTFADNRVREIFTGWDGLGGYHGLLIKKCASLLVGEFVLDVGCGLCHLFEVLPRSVEYTGIENNPLILEMALKRYPDLEILDYDMYDLSGLPIYDTVYAIGVYREEPKSDAGIAEMLAHAKDCVVMTYFTTKKGRVPKTLSFEDVSCEFIDHNIDERLEIVRLWKPLEDLTSSP
jgi:hypothetical protein